MAFAEEGLHLADSERVRAGTKNVNDSDFILLDV